MYLQNADSLKSASRANERDKVGDDEPGGQPGTGPEIEIFVEEEEREQAENRQPFIAQARRKAASALRQAFGQAARQGEGAAHAE